MTAPGARGQPAPFQAPQRGRPPRRLGTGAIIGILLAAVGSAAVLGAGIFTLVEVASTDRTPQAGDCVRLSSSRTPGEDTYHVLPCGDSAALFRVDRRLGSGSCGGDYLPLDVTDGTSGTVSLCLALNVRQGDCLSSVRDETAVAKTDCGSPGAEKRVVVYEGVADAQRCDIGDVPLSYSGPPARTLCLRDVGETT